MTNMMNFKTAPLLALVAVAGQVVAFTPPTTVSDASSVVSSLQASRSADAVESTSTRRDVFVKASAAVTAGLVAHIQSANAMDTEDFLKTGQVSMPMGVSGQAGKAKPVTGVVLREGSYVSRDNKGSVLAEILLGKSSDPIPVLATFSSPWPLATGTVFDVECRDASSGDGAFLTVAKGKDGQSVEDLSKSFFVDNLFKSTGRFSFYGAPTDIKVKKSEMNGPYRMLEITFSNLSQSTNAEIPRNALVAATIPEGTNDVVMLVGSATATRWRKGSEKAVRETVGTFKATLAPTGGLKVRAKEQRGSLGYM
mmetsp:Transcript_12374/g.35391  ORF Transcript_12374/g.35391 Transcript_12374/m.35391 type:complete len:310 (+) Transcript_12374:25-954(+)